MQRKYSSITLILSIVNWLPLVIYVYIYPPLPFSVVFLLMSFCSPIIAIICIIFMIFMICKRLPKVNLEVIVIIINLVYLVWSKYYLNILYHMT